MRSCEFSQSRFLEDIRTTAEAIAAPFSHATTRAVLDAYGPAFSEGAVLLRTTDRTGDDLDYRFYARRPMQRSQGVRGSLAAAVDAPQGVVTDRVAAVEVPDAVGAVEGGGQPVGMSLLGPARAGYGPIWAASESLYPDNETPVQRPSVAESDQGRRLRPSPAYVFDLGRCGRYLSP